jgi:hypothetical protein
MLAVWMLRYVDSLTGSPRYADLAELMEQGCLIEGKESAEVPRFLTADGLAKLYQRWRNDLFGPPM